MAQPNNNKLDERRVTPWYMTLAFAEVTMYAALNDDDEPRNPDTNVIYYERCGLNKISGTSAAQRKAGIVPEFTGNVAEETLPMDGRSFIDAITNPQDREVLQSIFEVPYSAEIIRKRLQDLFNRPHEDNLKLIFRNWEAFNEIEKLIIGDTATITAEDRENARKFSRLDNNLHAIIRSYSQNFFPTVRDALDFAQNKTMLLLGRYYSYNFEHLRSAHSLVSAEHDPSTLELLKDIEVVKNVAFTVDALLWLIFKEGVLTNDDRSKSHHYALLKSIGMIDANDTIRNVLVTNIAQFKRALAIPSLSDLKTIFSKSDRENIVFQHNIIDNVAKALYELHHLKEVDRKLRVDSSTYTVNAGAMLVDRVQWDKREHGTFMLTRDTNQFTSDGQKLIDTLYTFFDTISSEVLKNSILSFYRTLLTDLMARHTTSIIEVYVHLVEEKNHSIATNGMRKYVRGLLRPISYMETVIKQTSISGLPVINGIRESVERMFSTIPRFPHKLAWDNTFFVPPHETGVFPWLVPSLVRYENYSISIEGVIYDAMPCRRGAIISLLSALDCDPKHHRLTKDLSRRIIDACSVVLFINLRYRTEDAVFSPQADTGSTYAVGIHIKKTEIDPYNSVPRGVYKTRSGSRYIVFDSKRFTTHEFRTAIDVEHFIFETLLPPLVNERKPIEVVRTPLMVFRVIRSKSDTDSDEEFAAPSHTLGLPAEHYSTFVFVSQSQNPEHGNACTSYATIMAYFMFNGLGDLMLNRTLAPDQKQRQIDAQATLFNTLVDPFYKRECARRNKPPNVMTAFANAPELPHGVATGFRVKSMRQVKAEVRRCFRRYNPNHPAIARLHRFTSSADMEVKRNFADAIANRFEVARGLVMQEISAIMNSPLNIRYDPISRTYTTRPFAIGLTLSGHSILIFVDATIYNVDHKNASGTWIKPRSYFLYDSSGGKLVHLDTLIKLEEYILQKLPYKVFQEFTRVDMLKEELLKQNFYDTNVYFTDEDVNFMYNMLSDQLKGMGLYMEDAENLFKSDSIASLESIGMSLIGHDIEATLPVIDINSVRAVRPQSVNRSSIPLIKAANVSTAGSSAIRSTPLSPTRSMNFSSLVSGDQSEDYEELSLPTRDELEKTKRQNEKMESELKTAEQQKKKMEKEHAALEKQREKTRKEEERRRVELESLTTSVAAKQEKLETVHKTIEKKQEEINQKTKELKVSEERTKAVEAEKQAKQTEFEKQKEEEALLRQEEEAKEKESKSLEEEKKKQEQQRKAIEAETKRIEKEVEAQEKNIKSTQERLKRLNEKIIENERGTELLGQQIEEFNGRRAALLGQQEELERHDIEALRMEEELLQRLSEHTQLRLSMEEEVKTLENQDREFQTAQKAQMARQKQEDARQRQMQKELARQQRALDKLQTQTQRMRRRPDEENIEMEDAPDPDPAPMDETAGQFVPLMDDLELPDVDDNTPYISSDFDSENMDTT